MLTPSIQNLAVKGRNVVGTNARYSSGRNTIRSVVLELMAYAEMHGINFEAELKAARGMFAECMNPNDISNTGGK